MSQHHYLMESDEESIRLELKTDPRSMRKQARWAGIEKGMRVGDLGCGSGKTTYNLHRLVQPGGFSLGIDISPRRVGYAQDHYKAPGLDFAIADIRKPLEAHGAFDFIWIRFVLEYYRSAALDIVRNVCSILRPGGVLCLVDLDYNCLTHFGLTPALEKAMQGVMQRIEEKADFDPYVGRKLYSYMYDLGFSEIRVNLSAHHLIYGQIKRNDLFNWTKKIEIAARQSGYEFKEFPNGFEGFYAEFKTFFCDPRRFTYTPVIVCRGKKPY